jgi:hypothetical protein
VAVDESPAGTTYTEVSAVAPRPVVGAGCRSVWAGRYRKSTAGITVWRYRQIIDWCWNTAHTRITSKYRERWGRTYVRLWHFRGHIGSATAGGVGYGYFKPTERPERPRPPAMTGGGPHISLHTVAVNAAGELWRASPGQVRLVEPVTGLDIDPAVGGRLPLGSGVLLPKVVLIGSAALAP